jgi:hypothetical protein
MRTFFTIVVFIVSLQGVSGQVLISLLLGDKLNTGKIEFGLDGGVNYATIRGLSGANFEPNFNIGFYFDIKLKNPSWMIHTGVIVKSTLGAGELPVYSLGDVNLDNAFADGEVERKINYFNVPIMIKQAFKNNIYWEAGIVPSLRAKAYDIFTTELDGELEYKKDIKDDYHRLDFGLMGGVGYRLMGGNGMNLTVRYYYGLVDITINDSLPDQFNESIYLAVGIPIGAGKAKEKEAKKEKTTN